MDQLPDITITRPVTEADREWLAALRAPSMTVTSSIGRLTRSPATAGFTAPAPAVRPIPCHPDQPIL